MTYVSHTVRSLRRDPISGETVRLVLTPAENTPVEAVADAVESVGCDVVRELQFDRLLVKIDQSELDAVCELDEVSAVETDAVLDQT